MSIDERILSYLKTYPKNWGPTTRRLSRFVGVKPFTLRHVLMDLREKGLILDLPANCSKKYKRWVLK